MDEAKRNFKVDVKVYPIAEPKKNTLAFASVAVEALVAITSALKYRKRKDGVSPRLQR